MPPKTAQEKAIETWCQWMPETAELVNDGLLEVLDGEAPSLSALGENPGKFPPGHGWCSAVLLVSSSSGSYW